MPLDRWSQGLQPHSPSSVCCVSTSRKYENVKSLHGLTPTPPPHLLSCYALHKLRVPDNSITNPVLFSHPVPESQKHGVSGISEASCLPCIGGNPLHISSDKLPTSNGALTEEVKSPSPVQILSPPPHFRRGDQRLTSHLTSSSREALIKCFLGTRHCAQQIPDEINRDAEEPSTRSQESVWLPQDQVT